MASLKITFPISPRPKGSWRIGKYAKYNPSAKGQKEIRKFLEKQLPADFKPFSGPLFVIVHFRMPAYSSLKGTKRKLQNLLPHVIRPDGDNLEKMLNDALNGMVWLDDSQICWCLRSKIVTKEEKGRTIFFVKEIEKEKPNYQNILETIQEYIHMEDGLDTDD